MRRDLDTGEGPEPARVRDARTSELQRELPGLSVEASEDIETGEDVQT